MQRLGGLDAPLTTGRPHRPKRNTNKHYTPLLENAFAREDRQKTCAFAQVSYIFGTTAYPAIKIS
jgi:hypothetical protein